MATLGVGEPPLYRDLSMTVGGPRGWLQKSGGHLTRPEIMIFYSLYFPRWQGDQGLHDPLHASEMVGRVFLPASSIRQAGMSARVATDKANSPRPPSGS